MASVAVPVLISSREQRRSGVSLAGASQEPPILQERGVQSHPVPSGSALWGTRQQTPTRHRPRTVPSRPLVRAALPLQLEPSGQHSSAGAFPPGPVGSSPSTGTPWGTVGGFAVTLRRVGHGTSCPAGLFSEHPSPCSPATGALGKAWDRERNSVNRSVLRKLGTGPRLRASWL